MPWFNLVRNVRNMVKKTCALCFINAMAAASQDITVQLNLCSDRWENFPTILSGSVLIFRSQSTVAANIIMVLLICYLYTKPSIVSNHFK